MLGTLPDRYLEKNRTVLVKEEEIICVCVSLNLLKHEPLLV